MTSRIQIINAALLATKNNTCPVEFDGSDEWDVAYAAYERAVPVVLERGKFNFSTSSATLARVGDPPEGFDRWEHLFAKPAGCLMLTDVRSEGVSIAYDIHNDQILTRCDSVVGVFVREPPQNQWPHLLVETLTLYVEAGVLRGLDHDFDAADLRERRADKMFETTATRTDQQAPPRAMYQSRIIAARFRGRYSRGRYGPVDS